MQARWVLFYQFSSLGPDLAFFALDQEVSPLLTRVQTSLQITARRLSQYCGADLGPSMEFDSLADLTEDLFEQLHIRLDSFKESKRQNKTAVTAPQAAPKEQKAPVVKTVDNSYNLYVPLRSHKYVLSSYGPLGSKAYQSLES